VKSESSMGPGQNELVFDESYWVKSESNMGPGQSMCDLEKQWQLGRQHYIVHVIVPLNNIGVPYLPKKQKIERKKNM
jgi:hypothetical protein